MEIFQAKPLRRRAELFGATAECAILPVAIVKSPGRTAVYVDKILKGTMRANRWGLGRLPNAIFHWTHHTCEVLCKLTNDPHSAGGNFLI